MADSLEGLEAFMTAIISQESGGNSTARNPDSGAYGLFQFMPATYRNAAKLAGVSAAWPPSEENQRAAARALMTSYFNRFGNWRDVAISWYGGPGAVSYSTNALNRRQGGGKYPSINDYADKIIGRMDNADGGPPQPSPLSVDEIEQEVREQYPEYAWLLNDPEVRDILLEAADPQRGLDDATFTSRIRNTKWYQTSTPAMRQWETLLSQDPAKAKRQQEIRVQDLTRRAREMGIQMTRGDVEQMAERSLRYGWTNTEIMDAFAEQMAGDAPAGVVRTTMSDLRRLAGMYMVNASDSELVKWAQEITLGRRTLDEYTAGLQDLAKAKFNGNSQLVSMIDQGMSPDAFFADHKSMIAGEWGLSPTQVDLRDERWQGVLQTKGDDGVIRPMSLEEARRYARSQDGWDKTERGRAAVSEAALGLLTMFGEVRV